MKTKLEALFDNESFATDAINCEVGLMINEHNDVTNFMIVEYEGFFHVYLNLFDDGMPPFRDVLAEGIAQTLEEAQEIAIKNLNEMAYN